jgi:hypothetical protein
VPSGEEGLVFKRGNKADQGRGGPSPIEERIAALKAAHPELEIRRRKKLEPRHRVIVWLVFTWFVGALFPIGSTVVHALDRHQPVDFYELLGKGDLMVVALLASLAAFGDLLLAMWRGGVERGFWTFFVLAIEVILIGTAGVWFGDLSAKVLDEGAGDPSHPAAWAAIMMYGLSAILGSICVANAARGE